jgi:hypothetical protein
MSDMKTKFAASEVQFLLLWLLAALLANFVFRLLTPVVTIHWTLPQLAIALLTAIAQAVVLRGRIARPGLWALLSFLGLSLANLLVIWLQPALQPVNAMLGNLILIMIFTWLIHAALGFLAGLFQWVVLRREVQRAVVWLLAAALGNAVYAMSIYALLGFPGRSLHDYLSIALSSTVTGLFLILLLRRPLEQTEASVSQAAA